MQEPTKTEKMEVSVKNSMMVRPTEETPKKIIWTSNLDNIVPAVHVPFIYYYRPNGSTNFFDANRVKEALSRALIQFYPFAGRARKNKDGRIEIDCNEEGALFVEAEATSFLDDLGDFTPTSEVARLIPKIDYSRGISTYPLCAFQLTYFQCGGVSFGVRISHLIVDGTSMMHFINTWAYMAQGLDHTIQPFMDRTLLRARDPPEPKFPHIEFQPPPKLISQSPGPISQQVITKMFNFTSDQLNALKVKCYEEGGNTTNYTTFEVLLGHIWRCLCKAYGLADAQATKLSIATSVRSRLQPSLPPGYFGNAFMNPTAFAEAGALVSKPTSYAASRIHEAVKLIDDEYLRSTLDYLELHPDLFSCWPLPFQCPNLTMSNWIRFPAYDADFGWGRPVFMGPAVTWLEGLSYLLPRPLNDKSVTLFIVLQAGHMKLFEKYIIDI